MLQPWPPPKGSSVGSLISAGCLQVKGIPFLVFDAGGVLEMFDPKEFSDNVVFEPTLAALKRKLSSVVGPNASFISCAFLSTEIRCILAECLRQSCTLLCFGKTFRRLCGACSQACLAYYSAHTMWCCTGSAWAHQDSPAGRAHHNGASAVAALARRLCRKPTSAHPGRVTDFLQQPKGLSLLASYLRMLRIVPEAVGVLRSKQQGVSSYLTLLQDDTELDDQVRLLSGPEGSIRVVQLQPNQLSLKLWEPLCADNPNPGGPPLLLMPPEYEWLDAENGPRELAEIMYIGQRVSLTGFLPVEVQYSIPLI